MRTLILAAALVGLSGAAWGQTSSTPTCGYKNPSTNQWWATDQYLYPCVDAGGGTVTANPPALTPSAADANATTITTAGTLQTLFAAAACTHGSYVDNTSSAPLCVATNGQTGALACGTTASGQNIIVVQAGVHFPFGISALGLSITGGTTGQTFTKGCF